MGNYFLDTQYDGRFTLRKLDKHDKSGVQNKPKHMVAITTESPPPLGEYT